MKIKKEDIQNLINENPKITNGEIAKALSISIGWVNTLRSKMGIPQNVERGRPLGKLSGIKRKICDILNSEPLTKCFNDSELSEKLNLSRQRIAHFRHEMKIPPAVACKKGGLYRQYLYFSCGSRVIWSYKGEHTFENTGKTIFEE